MHVESMTDCASSGPAHGPVARLRMEYDALARRCAALCGRARAGDWQDLASDWSSFRLAIDERFAFEETALSGVPALVRRMDADHAALRQLLDTLGTQIRRRAVRVATIDVLLELLHEHGATEAATLHPWVAQDELALAATALRFRAAA